MYLKKNLGIFENSALQPTIMVGKKIPRFFQKLNFKKHVLDFDRIQTQMD